MTTRDIHLVAALPIMIGPEVLRTTRRRSAEINNHIVRSLVSHFANDSMVRECIGRGGAQETVSSCWTAGLSKPPVY